MGFDVTQMKDNMLAGFRQLTKENGSLSAQDIAKKILGGYESERLTSIFSNVEFVCSSIDSGKIFGGRNRFSDHIKL